jgi:hypothetical protein
VDVRRAADLYAQGRTLRQIGDEQGVSSTTVSDQLRRAGVTMRRGAPAYPASTQQILELHDQGLTWNEVAKQVDMTVSGAWSRYRRAQPPESPRLGRWQQVLQVLGVPIGLPGSYLHAGPFVVGLSGIFATSRADPEPRIFRGFL